MSIFTGIPITDLEKVIYFAGYIITKVHEAEKEEVMLISKMNTKQKRNATDEETKKTLERTSLK
jgi:hypothetical protein